MVDIREVGRVVALRGTDRRSVLERALQFRAEGFVPLIGDERWSRKQWDAQLGLIERAEISSNAAWASFTSGSTANPRIILRSEESWAASFAGLNALTGAGPGERLLVPVHPVSSMGPFSVAWADAVGMDWGVPARTQLQAADLCGGSTIMHGTPTHLRQLVELIESGEATTIHTVLIGGDALGPELRARAEAVGLKVVSYFGAAELSFVAVADGSGFTAFPGVEIELRDGQLWVKSDQKCLSVLGESSNFEGDAYGWASVGDRAEYDEAGYLRFLGRMDDAIMTAGATVIPWDVEAVLDSMPGVNASLVLGVDQPRVGKVVAAVIEPMPDAEMDLGELQRLARESLSIAQRPRRWFMVDQLPRTPSGKVRRLDEQAAMALVKGE